MDGGAPGRRAVLLAPIAVALAAGCSAAPAPAASRALSGRLTISTGSPSGVYHAWSTALRHELVDAFPRLDVTLSPSTGGLQNLRRVRGGAATLCLATADAVVESGGSGSGPDTGPDLVALARIYDDYVHLLVPATSGVGALSDLRGRPVAVGATGSGTALVARRVLTTARVAVRERDLGLDDGLTALSAGEVDAVFWSGGLPTPAVSAASERLPLRLVPLDALTGELRTRFGSSYRQAAVPSGTYQGADEVRTVVIANLLVARRELGRDLVLAVLGTLFGRREAIAATVPAARSLEPRSAIATQPVPLHVEAVEYYRAAKP